MRLRLRKDKFSKFVTTECARPIENRAVEILFQRHAVRLNRMRDFLVALAVFIPIEPKLLRRCSPRNVSPAVGHEHAADVEEDCSDHQLEWQHPVATAPGSVTASSPAMISGMAGLHGHERSPTRSAYLVVRD